MDWTGHSSWYGPITLSDHLGFLLAEDEAIKNYVSGLTVPNRNGSSSPVKVWFRWPEGERRISYPFITIDLLDVQPSYDRWTSLYSLNSSPANGSADFHDPISGNLIRKGLYQPSVSPNLIPPDTYDDSTHNLAVDNYLMHSLLYQISVHSRDIHHDRFLMSRFITDIFPPRPFWVGVDADSTWRRAEVVEILQSDTMETTESGSKRIFRKIYTVSMDAEIPQTVVSQIEKVLQVHVDVYQQPIVERELVTHASDEEHLIAEPITVVPEPIVVLESLLIVPEEPQP
jgi:hypothetical protein